MKKNFEGHGHHKAAKNEVKKVMSAKNAARSKSSKNIFISSIPSDGITVKDGNCVFHISDKSVETIASIIKLALENPALIKEHGEFFLSMVGKVTYANTLLHDQQEKRDKSMAEFLKVTQPEKS